MPNRQQSRAQLATAKKASGRTTKKKARPRPGTAKVVEMPAVPQTPPPPPAGEGNFQVDPQRIQAKMRDKLSASESQLALTEAAFDQSQDQVRALQAECATLRDRIVELEADEEADEDEDDEGEGE